MLYLLFVIHLKKKFYLIKQFRPFYFVRKKPLKYEIVGGLVDKGETLIQAIKREIKEEIGVKTKKLKKLTTTVLFLDMLMMR